MSAIRTFAGLCSAAILGLIQPLSPAQAADQITLRVEHFLPPQSTAQVGLLEPWAKKVMAASHGRLKIEIYPAMQLGGKPPQLYDQVKDGVIDAAWTLPGYTPGRFPTSEVFELPFMITTAAATSRALYEFYEKHLQKEFADVHPLAFHVHARGLIHTREKAVTKIEDLKGLKLRAPTRRVGQMLEELGATQIGMPVPQVPEALSKNVIDGAVVPYEVIVPLRVHELTKYHAQLDGKHGLYTSVFIFAMNKRKYDSLPADLKKAIDDNSGAALSQEAGRIWDQADVDGYEITKKAGGQFTSIGGAEAERFRKAAEPVIAEWIADMNKRGFDGKTLYNDALSLIEKYSK
ncbi:MAG TPA: TRAP transporter substrate-binding protein [Ferrovibrio sp.]|uniref:TRAP transporter substrate-binding protein n=1 Tax=Ferrovibrio sp. TaxID=1917215 RepID=UPI002ED12EB4